MDCVVKSWIFGTITNNLAASISALDSTARVAGLLLSPSSSTTRRRAVSSAQDLP